VRPPRAQFSAPSRKTSNARNRFKPGFPHHAQSAACEAQPATPGAGVLPIAGKFGVDVCNGTFEVAHGETQLLLTRRLCAGKETAAREKKLKC
jgi:hypothetical protein